MPISGRYVKLNIYPFSFKEYVEHHKLDSDFKTHFYNYLENGGMPSTFNCEKTPIIDCIILLFFERLSKKQC